MLTLINGAAVVRQPGNGCPPMIPQNVFILLLCSCNANIMKSMLTCKAMSVLLHVQNINVLLKVVPADKSANSN